MTGPRFRPLAAPAEWISVQLNGESVDVPRGMSVLAALLTHGEDTPSPDWFCAIGQCQRCRLRVNDREVTACQTYPGKGDRIETRDDWSG